MSLLDVTRYNDNIRGLKTFQDEQGDIRTTFTPVGAEAPILDVNFSNAARHVLSLFGLKEPAVEKYGVENRKGLWQRELTQIDTEINMIKSQGPGLTKEASGRLQELQSRQTQLQEAMRSTDGEH